MGREACCQIRNAQISKRAQRRGLFVGVCEHAQVHSCACNQHNGVRDNCVQHRRHLCCQKKFAFAEEPAASINYAYLGSEIWQEARSRLQEDFAKCGEKSEGGGGQDVKRIVMALCGGYTLLRRCETESEKELLRAAKSLRVHVCVQTCLVVLIRAIR